MSAAEKETGRLEAFSDGVFAFAITLLVLNLRDPKLDPLLSQKPLLDGLIAQWPSLLAMVTSFATILIMWVNHHSMFTRIKKIDTGLLFLNGVILFFVVLQPFTTQLVASHVMLNQTPDGETAAAVYSGVCFLLGIAWTLTGLYSFRAGIFDDARTERRYFVGPVFYAVAFGLSFINALASVVVILRLPDSSQSTQEPSCEELSRKIELEDEELVLGIPIGVRCFTARVPLSVTIHIVNCEVTDWTE